MDNFNPLNIKRPMYERNRVKAKLVTVAIVLGLVALVAAPAVTAKSVTGNVVSYSRPSGSNTGRLVISTGTGNVTLVVPAKFDKTLRPGWTVTVHYKSGKKVFGTYSSGPKKGKKFLAAVGNEVTKKPTVKNSGTGQIFTESEGGSGGGEVGNTSSGSSPNKPGCTSAGC